MSQQYNQLSSTHPRISERSQKIQSRPVNYRQSLGNNIVNHIVNPLDNQTSVVNSGRFRLTNNINRSTNNINRALDIKFRNRTINARTGQSFSSAQMANNPEAQRNVMLSRVVPNTSNGVPVNSEMTVLTNTNNSLRFNLASPVFDSKFNSRPIRSVNMTRNPNGSVNFAILYDTIIGTYPHYPSNPAYDNFITPFDVDSPIYKGMHYWQDGSIIF